MDITAMRQEVPENFLGLHPVLSKARHVDELPSYVIPDTDLEMGASLGNSSCWVTTKGTGDIENVFSTFLGLKVTGAICVRYSGTGRRLQRPFQEGGVQPEHDGAKRQDGQIHLYSQAPGRFELHPAFQRHEYELPGNILAEETVFVPSVTTPMQAHEHLEMESP
ncbi:MAG TPA: hypothetical protein VFU32_13805, partial [Ktedonobacterales bacterium]|nr:hypothetical protein [Ktedonobacterales bacterium]